MVLGLVVRAALVGSGLSFVGGTGLVLGVGGLGVVMWPLLLWFSGFFLLGSVARLRGFTCPRVGVSSLVFGNALALAVPPSVYKINKILEPQIAMTCKVVPRDQRQPFCAVD